MISDMNINVRKVDYLKLKNEITKLELVLECTISLTNAIRRIFCLKFKCSIL